MMHSLHASMGQRTNDEESVMVKGTHPLSAVVRHGNQTAHILLLFAALLAVLAGCGNTWQATVETPDGSTFLVDRQTIEGLDAFGAEVDGKQGVPLERLLSGAGHRAIERIVVTGADGARRELDWPAAAGNAWWLADGRLSINGESFAVTTVEVEPPALLEQVGASITDIAPTVAAALGIPAPGQATGQVLEASAAEHVLLLFLDGLGYVRYTEALDAGLIPNLAALGEPRVGLTVYPPSTSVASAALLTGAPPEVNGIDRRGIRKTELETLFDVTSGAGLDTVAVEGDALAFNLRNAEAQLSGDRDGDGSTDDNVLANTLAVLDEGMPNLLYVHFHGIDDAGHTHGPGAPEEEATIHEVDAAVGQIVEAMPRDTLIIIFADHGMHLVEDETRLGNHGHLLERDMFIPIFVVGK